MHVFSNTAAVKAGIVKLASHKGFYVGAAAVGGTAVGGFFLHRRFQQHRQVYTTSPTTDTPSLRQPITHLKPTILRGTERVEPTPRDQLLADTRCAGCTASPQAKQGLWYNICGKSYCQDCAPGAASKTGASLRVPEIPTNSSTATMPTFKAAPAYNVSLKPQAIKLGPLESIEGYAVTANGKEIGLTVTPAYRVDEKGAARVDKTRWFINYAKAGKAMAGPYSSVNEARRMAALLSGFDWNQSPEQFSDRDYREIARIINGYREDLSFEQYMRQIH